MSHVVIAGTLTGGITVYGPFASEHRAMKWVKCNGLVDLDDTPWEAVEMTSPLPEDHEYHCQVCGEISDAETLCDCEKEERRQNYGCGYDPVGGGGGSGRSDLPYGMGGGGD